MGTFCHTKNEEALCQGAGRELVLNDVLCYLFTKFGKNPLNMIKRVLGDFFSVNALFEAKSRLLEDASLLDIPETLPRVAKRHVGDESCARHADDILKIIEFLDEKKMLDKLPRYVTDDTDQMPMINLTEGDLKFFFIRLDKVEESLAGLKFDALEAIAADVHSLKQSYNSVLPFIHQALTHSHLSTYRAVNSGHPGTELSSSVAAHLVPSSSKSTEIVKPTGGRSSGNSTTMFTNNIITTASTTSIAAQPSSSSFAKVTQATGAGTNWAGSTSTPVRNRYDVLGALSSDDDGGANADGPWLFQRSGRHKRTLAQSSPSGPNDVSGSGPFDPRQQQPHPRQPRKPVLVGKRETGTTSLVAAKKIVINKIKKVVYYVDNLDPSTTAEDLTNFIKQETGVNVLTCFDVVPRRRPGDDADVEIRKSLRKAFRLCIKDEDRTRLLDPSKWPDSVAICQWIFHEKLESDGKRLRFDGQGSSLNDVIRPCLTVSSDARHAIAVTAPSSTASTSDANVIDTAGLNETDPDETEIMDTTVTKSTESNQHDGVNVGI